MFENYSFWAVFYIVVFLFLFSKKYGSPITALLFGPQLLHYFIKPLYLYYGGRPFLYADFFNHDFMLSALRNEVIFLVILALILAATRKGFGQTDPVLFISKTERTAYKMSVTITVLCFSLLLIVYGPIVFPENRTKSLTSTIPSLRFIFPFLLFSQIIIVSALFKFWSKRAYLSLFAGLVILYMGFSIMNQRGVIITAVLGLIGHCYYFGRISKSLLACLVLFLGLIGLFAKLLNTGSLTLDLSQALFVFEGPDSAALQVWSILYAYVSQEGHDFGIALVNGIFGIIPHTQRVVMGLANITDVLNVYYSPQSYLKFGFGFNGTLTQSLFLAFGHLSFLAYVPFCFAYAFIIRKSQDHFETENYVLSVYYAFLAITFISGGFQTLHWFIPLYLILFLSRLRFKETS